MRKELKTYSGLIICLLIASLNLHAQSKNNKTTLRIDSHIHLYDTDRKESFTFLNPVRHNKIYFSHLVPEFLNVAEPKGIKYAIVVEASYRREDNEWAMSVVNKSDNMLAFIANLDPRDENFLTDLENLSKNVKFRGIRLRQKNKIDLSDELILKKLGELAKRGLTLELGQMESVEGIQKIAKMYPQMNIVIDHMAGGRIHNNEIVPDDWNKRLENLAALPNVYCKISAIYNLSGHSPAPTDVSFYQEFFDRVVDIFGPERILFGSNWPLSEIHGSYGDLVMIYDKYLEKKEGISIRKFYAENAIRAYRLIITEQ